MEGRFSEDMERNWRQRPAFKEARLGLFGIEDQELPGPGASRKTLPFARTGIRNVCLVFVYFVKSFMRQTQTTN